MMLEQRTDPAEVERLNVIDPEDAMGVADIHGRWRMQDRLVDGADLKLDPAGVDELLGERNFVPAQPRHAHVHGDQTLARPLADEETSSGVDGRARAPGFLEYQIGDAARGVAAAFDFRSFAVPDAHAHIGDGRAFEHDHLIAADAGRAIGNGAGLRFAERNGTVTRVENDEIVAETIHLPEGN